MLQLAFFVIAFPAILVIVSPLGAMATFIGLTTHEDKARRLSTARRACIFGALILIICAASGSFIFQFFGISMAALKIAGGFLLLLICVDMVNGKISAEPVEAVPAREDSAVFPLAFPFLAGPGSIMTTFIFAERAKTGFDLAALFLAIALTMLISFIVFWQASRFTNYLGHSGLSMMKKLTGLLNAAIAVQFMISGAGEALPGLKGMVDPSQRASIQAPAANPSSVVAEH